MGGGILEHVRLRFLDIHDLASCAVEREEICRLHRFGTVYLFLFLVTTVYMSLRFSLKTGEYVYRITAEWQNGNRAEYGFAGWGLPTD